MFPAKNNIYFPSLNGWRALAAFLVILTHVERYKQIRSKHFLIGASFNSFLGGLSVSFFFVLSGFLISYLLLQEKETTGKIKIKNFLWKRALRICPLYFTVLVVGYLVSIFILRDTGTNPWKNGFVLNAFLLPNIAFAFYMIPEILIQIWSIGTEVQFYLVWPFIIKRNSQKKIFSLFVAIILFWFFARLLINSTIGSRTWLNILFFRTRIDCMAIGGISAMIISRKNSVQPNLKAFVDWITRPLTGWLLCVSFFVLLLISWHFSFSIYQAYAVLFAIVIIRSIYRPIKIIEYGLMNYLGGISYGIYLLHHFWVYFVFWLFSGVSEKIEMSFWGDVFFFIAASIFTIFSAMISYHFFEKRFLALKNKF